MNGDGEVAPVDASIRLPQGILLDIEGTTSSISFVYDQMFPFVRRELNGFLSSNWQNAEVRQACEQIAIDAGYASLHAWSEHAGQPAPRVVEDQVVRLMDDDVKATGLKALQGLIWKAGFDSGELTAHVYDDVPPALFEWHRSGRDLRIYSSGSVTAQRLFFGHTVAGNLLPIIRRHYDTTTGPKRETTSYAMIADDFAIPAAQILYLSDVPAELDAARAAGLRTCLVCRPGNAPVTLDCSHPKIHSFAELA